MSRTTSVAIVLAGLIGVTTQAAAEKSFADFPGLAGLERTTLSNPEGDRLDIIRYSGSEPLPAVVVIPGSLCAPVFAALDNAPGEAFATVPLLTPKERKALGSHLVYLERRNIVSLETMSTAPEFSIEQIFKLSPCTDRNGALTLEQRVADSLTQVRWLRQQDWVTSIHLVGVSEGSDVAAGVAATDATAVDSIMLIGGAGPTQFVDAAVFARNKGATNDVSRVFADLDQFLTSSAPDNYKGYDSKRWKSFAIQNSVFDLLLRSTVPVFIAHGEKDENVPISSADLVAIELMRKQPDRAIFYRSVTGGDHMLQTSDGRRIGDVIMEYASWAADLPEGRTFKAE